MSLQPFPNQEQVSKMDDSKIAIIDTCSINLSSLTVSIFSNAFKFTILHILFNRIQL